MKEVGKPLNPRSARLFIVCLGIIERRDHRLKGTKGWIEKSNDVAFPTRGLAEIV